MRSHEIKKLASAGDVGGLVRMYRESQSSRRTREKIVDRLRVIFTDQATVALAEVSTSDPDEVVRGIAASWLVDPKRDGLRSGLADFSKEDSRVVLAAVARSLGKNSSDESINLLGDLVRKTEPNVRWPALESLEKIGGPRVVDAVVPALTDPELVVRVRAAEVLAATGDPRAERLIERQAGVETGMGSTAMRASLEIARDRTQR